MGYGLLKLHHGIMKADAVMDYSIVKNYCLENGLPIIEPKGKHWHKIENATAKMVKNITVELKLNRGWNYYKTLLTPTP